MIRFIVDTTSSRADMYGNRYHFATITSTKTGDSLAVNVGGPSNARAKLRDAGIEWSEMHSSESEEPIRQWNRMAKSVTLLEHQVTGDDILALEDPDGVRL